MKIYRHAQLYGPSGILGIGKSNYFKHYISRPRAGEYIPGTRIKRLKVIRLGPQARGVPEAEVERIIAELQRDSEAPR
jgi:hypothetical protein